MSIFYIFFTFFLKNSQQFFSLLLHSTRNKKKTWIWKKNSTCYISIYIVFSDILSMFSSLLDQEGKHFTFWYGKFFYFISFTCFSSYLVSFTFLLLHSHLRKIHVSDSFNLQRFTLASQRTNKENDVSCNQLISLSVLWCVRYSFISFLI